MALRVRRIAVRFALLLALAAVVPLLVYGFISIFSLQRGTRESVIAGNQNVANRAAEEIQRYVVSHAELLKALAADLQDTGLETWQKDRILKNYVLQFREFREITLFDEAGTMVATSRVGQPRAVVPKDSKLSLGGVLMSPIRVDDDLLPTTAFGIHLARLGQPAGWLAGEFSLEEMWRMVDRIRIGSNGYAMVIAPGGDLIAHGSPDKKTLVAQRRNVSSNPLLELARKSTDDAPVVSEYRDDDGRQQLGVASVIANLGWTVVVEQPTDEAFAGARQLTRQLTVSIALALFGMIAAGFLFSRRYFIKPIHALARATHDVATEGRLETRVDIRTADEFADLGESFNRMADRLIEQQEELKKKERQAVFGRMAAGLVHDLSHPVQNIGNSTRLLMRDDVDPETREMFRKTIERELATLKRFMEDLRNLVKPKPIERFAMDINGSVQEVVDTMRAEGERNGVAVSAHYAEGPLVIEGDRFALSRVYRNLITNAIQATAPGGSVTVRTARVDHHVEVTFADTGSGIPADKLTAIFEDFVSTKTRGLGLGLAISKRIVEQLGGTINVQSEVGRGTSFTLRFPARDDLSAHAAAS